MSPHLIQGNIYLKTFLTFLCFQKEVIEKSKIFHTLGQQQQGKKANCSRRVYSVALGLGDKGDNLYQLDFAR